MDGGLHTGSGKAGEMVNNFLHRQQIRESLQCDTCYFPTILGRHHRVTARGLLRERRLAEAEKTQPGCTSGTADIPLAIEVSSSPSGWLLPTRSSPLGSLEHCTRPSSGGCSLSLTERERERQGEDVTELRGALEAARGLLEQRGAL